MRRDPAGPYSLQTLQALPRPRVYTRDYETLKRRYVAWYEEASGRQLFPMQVEMLLVETLAYAMSVLGAEAQIAAEEHLVAFASETGLEPLAANRSTPRLPAAPARANVRFTETGGQARALATGTRLAAGDRLFLLQAPVVVPAMGQATGTVIAEIPGDEPNGLGPGAINRLLTPVAGLSVVNIDPVAGGAPQEPVEAWRLRIANAFERISTMGSRDWYRETALGMSAALIDVAVVRPQPCHIELYPLTREGAPSPPVLAAVAAAFDTAEAVDHRFGDQVTVLAPVLVTLSGTLTARVRGAGEDIAAQLVAAVAAVVDDWQSRLAPEIAPSEITSRARQIPGVIDASLTGFAWQKLQAHQYARVAITVAPVVEVPA